MLEISLPLPFKGFDLASFSRNQILSLPINFIHVPNNNVSENRVKIAQANFLIRKRKKKKSPSNDYDSQNNLDKKPRTRHTIYTGSAPGYPPGWKNIQKRRLGGKGKGHVDNYWISPKTGKKFQSNPDATKFLDCLDMKDGDEDKAFSLHKEVKKNCGVIRCMQSKK